MFEGFQKFPRVKVIGLTGPMGSGKTTVAKFFEKEYDFHRLALASPIKQMCVVAFNDSFSRYQDPIYKEEFVPGQLFTRRKAMQIFGTEGGRSLDPLIWIRCLYSKMNNLFYHAGVSHFIIDDVRFPNEAVFIKALGGKLIQLRGEKNKTEDFKPNPEDVHASEAFEIPHHTIHGHIINNRDTMKSSEEFLAHHEESFRMMMNDWLLEE